jgi:dihydrolipoamide dehydrogenase
METFDIVVIGAGPGGYPAALRAAQLGARTALVEKEQLGGTCLNWGCIPTKTLIAAAHSFWTLRHEAAAFGIRADNPALDYAALQRHKTDVVARLRGGIAQLLKANGVSVFTGAGSFADRRHVRVSGGPAGEVSLEARHVILATGTVSAMPGFLPQNPRVLDSRAFLDLDKLPASLLVLGGGIIGCELACMAAQLGANVTVVELLPDILAVVDPDVRREVRRAMEKTLGITVLTGQPLEKIKATASGIQGDAGGHKLEAEALLVAVGRKPVTEGLNLEAAGLKPDAKGFLETDDTCRTRAASIFAVGDLAGRAQLAHAATAMGVVAAENACGQRASLTGRLIPSAVFTVPEVGTVGLGEEEAKQQNRNVRVGKFPFAALGRALASNEAAGFVKWIADAETDQLLGAQTVGPHATDLLATAALAVQGQWTAAEFGRVIHAHPTFAEAWMEAAHAVHGACLHAPPRKPRKPEDKP